MPARCPAALSRFVRATAGVPLALLAAASLGAQPQAPARPAADLLLRGGTVLDGTGGPARRADVAIVGDRLHAVGPDLLVAARETLDVRGLMVAPGFLNLHSHPSLEGLRIARNMLTQGVTTEFLNPDGGGPVDVAAQLAMLDTIGLAVNAGAYVPFNSLRLATFGMADRPATDAEIARMRGLVEAGLRAGAWGVAAGLDYKPGYYASTDEVVRVVDVARRWRTNFPNHERVMPEHGYSGRVGIAETMEIGGRAGLVPVITHMKVQGREQGQAASILAMLDSATAAGTYVATDVYPYLAGQTSLSALIIPGWAQQGGRAAMLARFADTAQRARIAREAEAALNARFGGAPGVFLLDTREQLVDVMRTRGIASVGEAIVRILEEREAPVILGFGIEPDVEHLLAYPAASMACDCGAQPDTLRAHPRFFGSYPRVLGRYVRERRVLTWTDAIRKMTALPAATVGMHDRGVLAPGMAADVVVFDSARVIDRATYERPNLPSEGIVHVIVNGRVALRDGATTGTRAGRALRRHAGAPSRPFDGGRTRGAVFAGTVTTPDGTLDIAVDVTQDGGTPTARGALAVRDAAGARTLHDVQLGYLQVAPGWSSISGTARIGTETARRGFTLVFDAVPADAAAGDPPRVRLEMQDRGVAVGPLAAATPPVIR